MGRLIGSLRRRASEGLMRGGEGDMGCWGFWVGEDIRCDGAVYGSMCGVYEPAVPDRVHIQPDNGRRNRQNEHVTKFKGHGCFISQPN